MHEGGKSTIAIGRPKTVMQHNILELKLWALLEVENKRIRGSLWKYRQSSVFKFQFLHFFECYAQKKYKGERRHPNTPSEQHLYSVVTFNSVNMLLVSMISES